jgi:DnaJ-like protein C11, C-terminal
VQGRTANVTDLLRSMVSDGGLTLNVNNRALGGDPAPGAGKVLIVVYRFRGQEQATAVGEGNRLDIP